MPIEQALIEFYRQGATVNDGPVTIANTSTGTVSVFGLGAIVTGDIVRIGFAGPKLTVTATNPVTLEITLSNTTGSSVTIDAGSRLLDLTARPTAYADALGAYPIGTSVRADSSGRVVVYLVDVCDYVVNGNPPVPDTYSTGTLTGNGPTLTVSHTMAGHDRLMLVAISWQETTGLESIDSVAYDGIEMLRLTTGGVMVAVFGLLNPPTSVSPLNVVITWSGTSPKGAVAAVQGFSRVHKTVPYGPCISNSGSGTSASANIPNTQSTGLVLAALAVNTVSGTATVTPGAGSTGLWDLTAGTAPDVTRLRGSGATKPSNESTVTPGWTLSGSRPWEVAGIEVIPAGTRLYADQGGATCRTREYGLNATHYVGIQEAIDALPSKGGVLYIPAGTYRLRRGLVIDKPNVSLIGEGDLTIITPADPENLPIDLLTISAEETRISLMKFDGAASEMDLDGGTSCVVVNGQGLSENLVIFTRLENVTITRASRYGLWLRDTIAFIATNCNVASNLGTGLRIQGTPTPLGSAVAARFYSCNMSYNGSIGAEIGDPYPPLTGVVGITFFGCAFEGNQGNGIEDLSACGTGITAIQVGKMEILSCYFEVAPEGAAQFVWLGAAFTTTVDNCWFEGGSVEANQPAHAVSFANCQYSRFSNNSVEHTTAAIVVFDTDCFECIEFGNRDMSSGSGVSRITIDGFRVIGMSRRAMGIPRHFDSSTLPGSGTTPQPGSLVWVDSLTGTERHLRVWDGSSWRGIDLV